MGLHYREIERVDFVTFRGMFQSCERCLATDILERVSFDLGVAAYGAGSETAYESLEEKLDVYRFVLGQKSQVRQKGMAELQADFGRGL